MKNHSNSRLYVFAFVAAMSLSAMMGCNDGIKEDEQKQAGKIAVSIRMTTENSSMLKLASDKWEPTDLIGLYMKKAGQALTAADAIFEDANNLQMTYSTASDRLVAATTLYYPDDENIDFVAYYPWNEDTGAAYTLAIDLEDQTAGLPELLYSNNAVNKEASNETIDLLFKYAYAKISLTVFLPDRTNAELNNATVTITGMNAKATFLLADGTFTAPESGDIRLRRLPRQNSVVFFEALVMPANVGDDAKFVLETGGKTYELSAAGNYEAGKLYNLDRAIGDPNEINNLLLNPGFEIGDNNGNQTGRTQLSNATVIGWEVVPQAWFNEFYKMGEEMIPPMDTGPGTGYNAPEKVSSGIGNWWTQANGVVFVSDLQTQNISFPYSYTWRVGNNICRVGAGANNTSGFYQLVPVTPGKTYRFGGKVGARTSSATMGLDTDAKLMILSLDGMTVHHVHRIDFEEGDPDTPELTMFPANTSGDHKATFFIAEGEWKNDAGVTHVRFQYDHRHFTETPIICCDEMFFRLVEEEE